MLRSAHAAIRSGARPALCPSKIARASLTTSSSRLADGYDREGGDQSSRQDGSLDRFLGHPVGGLESVYKGKPRQGGRYDNNGPRSYDGENRQGGNRYQFNGERRQRSYNNGDYQEGGGRFQSNREQRPFGDRRGPPRDGEQRHFGDRRGPPRDGEQRFSGDRRGPPRGKTHVSSAVRTWPQHEIPSDAKTMVCESPNLKGGPLTVAWTEQFLFVEDKESGLGRRALKPSTLRDSCTCPRCRDPDSTQKNFASTQIPLDIGFENVRSSDEGLHITFKNDIKEWAEAGHEMLFPWSLVEFSVKRTSVDDIVVPRKRSVFRRTGVTYWDKAVLEREVRSIDYADFMQGGEAFWDVIIDICRFGIVYLRNVPDSEEAVLSITNRIANNKGTFYGETFDVVAKPNAENVAYTSGYLDLHQDLLYLEPQPMIQVLHCRQNSCEGGESLFSDGDRVGRLLYPFLNKSCMAPLADHFVPYGYEKNGYRYFASRYVIDTNDGGFVGVNWGPPFQARYLSPAKDIRRWIAAARIFESLLHDEGAIYRRKMEPGECVIFDNLRVLHGRTAFDTESVQGGGSRFLKGSYIAAEDFLSRASHIPAGQAEKYRGDVPWSSGRAQAALRQTDWHRVAESKVRELAALERRAQLEREGEAAPEPTPEA